MAWGEWDLCIYQWILFVCLFNIPLVILWVQVNRKKTVYFLYLDIFIGLLRLPYQLYLHLIFPSLQQKFSIVQAIWSMIFCYIRQSTLRQVIYPKVLKAGYWHICTCVFMAELFTTAKKWKQPTCPLVNEWLNRMWCIHTMVYFSALQSKEILTHSIIWMNLECI